MIEIAYGLQAVGSIFGGRSKRKADKRRAAFQRRQVTMQRDYALEDLRLSSMDLQGQIMAGAAGSGVRTSSGNVRATQADELLKESRRAARIMAGSEMELQAIANNLKTEKRAATTGTLMDLASIGVSYYGQNSSA